MPVNYQLGKVYSIRSYKTTEIYIGSTCSLLSKRISGHRANYKTYLKGKGNNVSSFKILEFGDAYIELLELYPSGSKAELHKREGELIRATENCVNKYVPGRTKKQHYQDHKVEAKQYYVDHKVEIKQYMKQYRDTHKVEAKQYIKQYSATRVRCQCGIEHARGGLSRHKKSNKHKQEMEILELAGEL